MAMSDSRAFVPPVNQIKDTDPMLVRVPMDKTDIGFRKSQQTGMNNDHMGVNNLSNGK